MTDKPAGDVTVFITLGHGNEFALSDSSMMIRNTNNAYYEDQKVIDLGAPTVNEFDALIKLMKRLRCHLKDE
jgi:hypothetical protein